MDKNPPPPQVGDVFQGIPEVLHKSKYHVRAVVDVLEDKDYGWTYQVVVKFWVDGKGDRYQLISAHEIGLGLYKQVSA